MVDLAAAPLARGPRQRVSARLGLLAALLAGLMLFAIGRTAHGADNFPALTGRVVDDANLLSAESQSAIESKLKSLEEKSGIQLVVATVKSLGGDEIEPFANRLFRAWKLGEKTKNNGVLLLVAPAQHKARIEVGYGLEGTLTDAISKLIITNAMIPRFKTGDFQGGIERGVEDIISVLSTDAAEWHKRADLQPAHETNSGLSGFWTFAIVFGVIVLIIYFRRKTRWIGAGRGGGAVFIPTGGFQSDSSGSSSSSSDSGFSGGGGSSGGGGASGDW